MTKMKKDWSCDLEAQEYAEDKDLLIQDAIKAVEETEKDFYVNLVTPANFGHPDHYLVPILQDRFNGAITTRFVDQCGCGGFVLRVTKKSS